MRWRREKREAFMWSALSMVPAGGIEVEKQVFQRPGRAAGLTRLMKERRRPINRRNPRGELLGDGGAGVGQGGGSGGEETLGR